MAISASRLREFAAFLGLSGYAASTIQQYVSAVQVVAQVHCADAGRRVGRQAIVATFARRPGRGAQPMACLSFAVLRRIVVSESAASADAVVFVAMLLVQLFTLARAESVSDQPRYGWRKVLLRSDIDASGGHETYLKSSKFRLYSLVHKVTIRHSAAVILH